MQKKKMIRNLNKKLGAKFPSTTLGSSVVRISCHDDAFPGILKLEASPVEEKGKAIKKKSVGHFLVQNVDFCACPRKNIISYVIIY